MSTPIVDSLRTAIALLYEAEDLINQACLDDCENESGGDDDMFTKIRDEHPLDGLRCDIIDVITTIEESFPDVIMKRKHRTIYRLAVGTLFARDYPTRCHAEQAARELGGITLLAGYPVTVTSVRVEELEE